MSNGTELYALVAAGERAALVDWLEALPKAERPLLLKPARALFKEWSATIAEGNTFRTRGVAQTQCAWLALYAADAAAATSRPAYAPAPEHLVAITARLQPPGLSSFVASILPRFWERAAALVEAGLAPRPAERLWALGMMGAWGRAGRASELLAVWEPVLLRDVSLLFAHEGEGEFSLSSFTGSLWADQFRLWVEQGKLARSELLDHCLSALLQGFAPGRQTFFTGLFDSLSPSADECLARTGSLQRLLGSAAGATVGWALGHLRGALEAAQVPASALEGALMVRSAATAKAAVGWLALRQKAAPEEDVASVLQNALSHADVGVQAAAAQLLLGSVSPARLPSLVEPHREAMSPRVRKLFAAIAAPAELVSVQPAVVSAVTAAAPANPLSRLDPLAPERAIARRLELDDHALLTAIAAWIEAAEDVDRGELLLAELARRPRPDTTVAAHCKPLVRTWAKRLERVWDPGALLALVAQAWALGIAAPEDAPEQPTWSSQRLYRSRALELVDSLLAGEQVFWCSLPTHRGGHLDRRVAVRRWEQRKGKVLPADLALAWQRLSGPPHAPPAADGDPLTEAWRYVMGGPPPATLSLELWGAAAHARSPEEPDRAVEQVYPELREQPWRTLVGSRSRTLHTWANGGVSKLLGIEGSNLIGSSWWQADGRDASTSSSPVRSYLAAPELSANVVGAFAHDRAVSPVWSAAVDARSLHELVHDVGSTETDTRNPGAVTALIDCAVPLGPVGHELLAAALLSPHPVVRLAGVDLAIASAGDGRLQPAQLADGLALLTRDDFYPLNRAVTGLAEVARAGFAPVVVQTWLHALPLLEAVRDVAKVLAQLDPLLLDHPAVLPPATVRALQGFKSGKAAALARAILGR